MIVKFTEKDNSFNFFLPKVLTDLIESWCKIQSDFVTISRKISKVFVVCSYASFESVLKGNDVKDAPHWHQNPGNNANSLK